ncbi:MAG: hypothetical protein Rubg2KO_39720 [Rubricoccaceae bacterium]
MPARTLFLLAALALPHAASAQSGFLAARGVIDTTLDAASLAPYAGTYAADGGSVELAETHGALRILATGAPIAAALVSLAPGSNALDARANVALTAWVAGDTAPLVAAVPPIRQLDAAADFSASRSALTRRLGDMMRAEIIGTFRQTNGQRATLARVHFERGRQWISLVWTNTGELATIKRGLSPIVVGLARPTGPDTFDSAGVRLTFSRDATGRIYALAVGRQLVATR